MFMPAFTNKNNWDNENLYGCKSCIEMFRNVSCRQSQPKRRFEIFSGKSSKEESKEAKIDLDKRWTSTRMLVQ